MNSLSSLRANLLVLAGVFLVGLTSAHANTVLICFSGSATGDPNTWNVVNPPGSGGLVVGLLDSTNVGSGITMTESPGTAATGTANFGTTFGSNGGNGYTLSGTTPIVFPAPAGTLLGSEVAGCWYLGGGSSATLTFTGLDTTGATTYTFSFLSARGNSSTTTGRLADFKFTGATTVDLGVIDSGTSSGTGNTNVYSASLKADGTGTIVLTVDATMATAGFGGYLNAMEITSSIVPEPSTIALAILGGLGLFVVVLRRRSQAQV